MSRQSEGGAVAIIVAVFIAFVAVGILALAVDIGSLWQSQRALVTDTDAAALAGAIELAEDWMENGGECGDRAAAEAEAVSVLALNNPDNQVIGTDADCGPSPSSAVDFSGWVEMTARQPSPGFVSGRDDLSAGGTTTAEFLLDISDFEEGLAVCAELFLGTGLVNESFALSDNKFAIPYTKATQTLVGQGTTACGIAGQWETSGSPANSTKGGWGWLQGVCGPVLPGGTWCDVSTGNQLKSLESSVGDEIRFPIFEAWNDRGGNNADLLIVGHMTATVESTCELKGGGNDPKNPKDCNLSSNLSDKFTGQQEFIVVSGARPFFYDDPVSEMFDEAEYSICDVQGDQEFCRSNG
jgi:hypothetical protein